MKSPNLAPPGTKQVLLAFSTLPERAFAPAKESVSAVINLTRPFLPLGLFLWGATEDTFFRCLRVGAFVELDLEGMGRVPGRFFQANRSFDELKAMADRNELELTVEQRQVLEMEEASSGNNMQLVIEGPFKQVCAWGLTYDSAVPLFKTVIRHRRQEGQSDYCGTLLERRLKGERPLLEVEAPTEAAVAQLLCAGMTLPQRRW